MSSTQMHKKVKRNQHFYSQIIYFYIFKNYLFLILDKNMRNLKSISIWENITNKRDVKVTQIYKMR